MTQQEEGTVFIIKDLFSDREITTASLSSMTLEDAVKAIHAYDRMRRHRSEPRKAPLAESQEELALAYEMKRISRQTYYRRLKRAGLPPSPPKWMP